MYTQQYLFEGVERPHSGLGTLSTVEDCGIARGVDFAGGRSVYICSQEVEGW